MQEPEPELEVDSEIIRYTLTWRAVVGATPIANTAKRVYIYGGFVYFQLIAWIDEVRAKHPGRFEPIALIQAAASYDRGTKKDEVIMDLHGHKDIQAMDSVLDAWHSDKRKGLKVEVTATLLELSMTLNPSNPLGGHATQALSTQLETLIEAMTGRSKKGKASGGSATAI